MYRAMCVIYAFMRLTDDIADAPMHTFGAEENSPCKSQNLQHRLEQLNHWREDFRSAIAGKKMAHPLFPALTEVVAQFQIDPQWLEDVIQGVELDLHETSFPVYEDTLRYCYHVAGTVGLCCQAVWGADLSKTRPLALACGQAFQLTNILRDLHEDACNFRCYLPAEDLNRFGCSVSDFAAQRSSAEFLELMQFQVDRVFQCYQQAALLENDLQGPGLKMFRKMFCSYYLLLCKIARSPEKVLKQRVRLSSIQKVQIVFTAGNRSLEELLKNRPVLEESR